MAFVSGPALPSARASRTTNICQVRMGADKPLSRRVLLAGAAAAAAAVVILPGQVFAEREYANVGFLGGGEQIDVNNANVRVYKKIQGFYPNLAGLIVSNGPYKTVDELFELKELTPEMKEVLEKNKDKLVALKPTFEYEIDKINNGLYK